MKYLFIKLLIFALGDTWASIYSSHNVYVPSLIEKRNDVTEDSYNSEKIMNGNFTSMEKIQKPKGYSKHMKQKHARDVNTGQNEANLFSNVPYEESLNTGSDMTSSILTKNFKKNIDEQYLHTEIDPMVIMAKRRSQTHRQGSTESGSGSSASLERKIWKDEWHANWMQKKFEAINSSQLRGDVANMVAARPWGVPCGDPNQHDVPWGTCTLAMQCDGEYRIYRGDFACGRNQFVCCAVILTNYDLYQGIDVSFEDSSMSTQEVQLDSRESTRKKQRAERKRRKKARDRRKRTIKKSIRKIVMEIRKTMNRAFRNATVQRKRRTKDLMKYIDELKKRFREDRGSAVFFHQYAVVKDDEDLQSKLDQVKDVNVAFMGNDTFRDIIVNGTVNTDKLAALLRVRPGLAKLLMKRRNDGKVKTAPNITVKESEGEGMKSNIVKRRTDIQVQEDNLKPNILEVRSDEEVKDDGEEPNIIVSQNDEEVQEDGQQSNIIKKRYKHRHKDKKKPHIPEYDIEFGQLYY